MALFEPDLIFGDPLVEELHSRQIALSAFSKTLKLGKGSLPIKACALPLTTSW
jgi:hypothetical protein